MTNKQTRLLAASLAMVAGSIGTHLKDEFQANLGLSVLIVAVALFLFEYWRCTTPVTTQQEKE